jgi:sec-independent protein translocase protein TatA
VLNGFGWPHLLIIAVLLIVLFGAKRLPDAARGIGRSLNIFKSEVRSMQDEQQGTQPQAGPQNQAAPQQQIAAQPVPPVAAQQTYAQPVPPVAAPQAQPQAEQQPVPGQQV